MFRGSESLTITWLGTTVGLVFQVLLKDNLHLEAPGWPLCAIEQSS